MSLHTMQHGRGVNSALLLGDGKTVASAAMDYTVWMWDVSGEKPEEKVHIGPHSDLVNFLAISFKHDVLAAVTLAGEVKLWDVSGDRPKEKTTVVTGHSSFVHCVAFSHDSKTLASASWDHTIKLWDVSGDTPKEKGTLNGHFSRVSSVAFSPIDDGKTLASASFDGTVKLWDTDTKTVKCTLGRISKCPETSMTVSCVAFSPDGLLAFTSGRSRDEGRVEIWDTSRGRPVRKTLLEGHSAWVWRVVFSGDGKTIASASFDETARLWDVATGDLKATLTGHSGRVSSVAFSPDNKMVVSASDDFTVKVWPIPDEPVTVDAEARRIARAQVAKRLAPVDAEARRITRAQAAKARRATRSQAKRARR